MTDGGSRVVAVVDGVDHRHETGVVERKQRMASMSIDASDDGDSGLIGSDSDRGSASTEGGIEGNCWRTVTVTADGCRH